MRLKYYFFNLAAVFVLLLGVAFNSSAQTTGTLSISGSAGNYTVYYTPTTEGTFYGGSIVGITAPSGSATLGAPTSINGTWEIASLKASQGGLDYWAYSNSATVTISAAQIGRTITLFSLTSSGTCAGGSFNINPSNNTTIAGFDYSSYIDNSGGTPANTGVRSPNTALCTALTPTLSCSTSTLSPSTYTIGTPSSGTYTVGVQNLVANTIYTFTESTSANIATNPGTFSYTATGAETTVAVPISYDGAGSAGTQTVTITLTATSGTAAAALTCPVTAQINPAAVICNAGSFAPSVR